MSGRDAGGLGAVDRPNSYIGRSVPRPNARRLLAGRGEFVDDVRLPRLAHVAFFRSPHAHARIVRLDTTAAQAAPGVIRVATAADLEAYCTPWVGVLTHFKGLKSAPQYPLARERVRWQGEPVVAVVARSRAEAEDAAQLVEAEFEELPAVTDMETALDPATPLIHPELGDNLAFERRIDSGQVDAAFRDAALVVESTFRFGRHTGVTLEPRSIVADFDPSERRLTVHHSSQAPQMMQRILAKHLNLAESDVRVVCRDVGGSFGIKIHIYADEMAAAALSVMLGRPVKFVADRMESFLTDIHARDHRVTARLAMAKDGEILAFDIDDLTGIGPHSMYPRTSAVEANQVINLIGGPYRMANYRARARVVLQNKNLMSQYRAVGHPIACAVTEGLVDQAARQLGLDPVAVRRRNYIPVDGYPWTSPQGMKFEALSHQKCLDKLVALIGYDRLRAEQAELRGRGVHRGLGIAAYIEITSPGPAFYGVGGAPISAQDGCTLRLDTAGNVICHAGVTEQGQGTDTMLAQVVATAMGVPVERVRVTTGDTAHTPYGGGTWASRGAGIGGEAALQAGNDLRARVLALAGVLLQRDAAELDIRDGQVVERATGAPRMPLEELARIAYFRQDTLPKDLHPELVVTRHYSPRDYPFAFTNGVHACWLEVDTDTGFVTLLKHWVVEDCGRIINPLLVDEQVRGGVVQGIGGALFEECRYDAAGNMLNASMADYLVPMAAEMPDIAVAHVETPTRQSELGAKGAGEAGVAASPAAVMNAINDALAPFGAVLTTMPFTPERILRALGKI